eukprot:3795324-Amphidinium_carterae.2
MNFADLPSDVVNFAGHVVSFCDVRAACWERCFPDFSRIGSSWTLRHKATGTLRRNDRCYVRLSPILLHLFDMCSQGAASYDRRRKQVQNEKTTVFEILQRFHKCQKRNLPYKSMGFVHPLLQPQSLQLKLKRLPKESTASLREIPSLPQPQRRKNLQLHCQLGVDFAIKPLSMEVVIAGIEK